MLHCNEHCEDSLFASRMPSLHLARGFFHICILLTVLSWGTRVTQQNVQTFPSHHHSTPGLSWIGFSEQCPLQIQPKRYVYKFKFELMGPNVILTVELSF